jgi:hypothetical protein
MAANRKPTTIEIAKMGPAAPLLECWGINTLGERFSGLSLEERSDALFNLVIGWTVLVERLHREFGISVHVQDVAKPGGISQRKWKPRPEASA